MKNSLKFTILLLLISAGLKTIFPQDVSLGIGLNLPAGSSTQSMGFGIHLMNEYCFMEQYSARLNASASISGLNASPYMGVDSYGFEEYEASFLYYFMKSNTRPYAGIGIGYYVPNTSTSSNANMVPGTDEMVSGNNIDSNLGMNFIAGMKFQSLNFFSVGLEMKYNYVKTDWSANIIGPRGNFYKKDLGKIDISQLVINLNFIFNF